MKSSSIFSSDVPFSLLPVDATSNYCKMLAAKKSKNYIMMRTDSDF